MTKAATLATVLAAGALTGAPSLAAQGPCIDEVAKLEQAMISSVTGATAVNATRTTVPPQPAEAAAARGETSATPALSELIGGLAKSAQDVRAQMMGKPTNLQVAEGADRPTGVPTQDVEQAAIFAAIAQAKVMHQIGQEQGCLVLVEKGNRLAGQP